MICIEEQDGPILEIGKDLKCRLLTDPEMAVGALQVKMSGAACGSADKNICQSIAIDVCYGCPGAFTGEHFGKIAFVMEVFVIIFFLFEETALDRPQQQAGGIRQSRRWIVIIFPFLLEGIDFVEGGIVEL